MQVTRTYRGVADLRWIKSISSWFEWVGIAAIICIVLSAVIDVVGSKLFNWPLPGSPEIVSVLQIIAIAGNLAFSKIDGRHIRIDLFVNLLRGRSKYALEIFDSLLALGFFMIVGWMTFEYGLSLYDDTSTTATLGIPYYPFALWITLSCIPLCCVILVEIVNFIGRVIRP